MLVNEEAGKLFSNQIECEELREEFMSFNAVESRLLSVKTNRPKGGVVVPVLPVHVHSDIPPQWVYRYFNN